MGRAASFNSPEGIWQVPHEKQEEPLVRQSSGHKFGSRSRGGEEGRVRGGLPRVSSTLSVSGSHLSRSPSTSLATSPASSRRQSAEWERPEQTTSLTEGNAEVRLFVHEPDLIYYWAASTTGCTSFVIDIEPEWVPYLCNHTLRFGSLQMFFSPEKSFQWPCSL